VDDLSAPDMDGVMQRRSRLFLLTLVTSVPMSSPRERMISS